MSTLAFDTHAFVKRLTAVGITEEQAEVFADQQTRLIDETSATKLDIELVRRDMKEPELALKGDIGLVRRDLKKLELATKRNLKELEGALKSDIEIRIRESELRMLKWVVPLLLVQGGLTAALVKWIL